MLTVVGDNEEDLGVETDSPFRACKWQVMIMFVYFYDAQRYPWSSELYSSVCIIMIN